LLHRRLRSVAPCGAGGESQEKTWDSRRLGGWRLDDVVGFIGFVEVHFADTFGIAHGFYEFAYFFAEFEGVFHGGDFDFGEGAVGGFEMDGSEAGEAHPPDAYDEDVFDAVEFHFVNFLVDEAGGDAEALCGEFEGVGAEEEVEPEGVDGGDDESEECGYVVNGGDDYADGEGESDGVVAGV
jgi:hypothetical protein